MSDKILIRERHYPGRPCPACAPHEICTIAVVKYKKGWPPEYEVHESPEVEYLEIERREAEPKETHGK